MSWREELNEEIKKYLDLPEEATVLSYEEVTQSDGYCETCYYEYQEAVVTYSLDGQSVTKNTGLNLADFMSQL